MNIVWTPVGVYLALGLGLLLLGVAALLFVLSRRGRKRAMTPTELADRINRFDRFEVLEPRGVARGHGVQVETSLNIADFRRMAKRGEWAVFWISPFVFFGLAFGILSLAAAASSSFGEPAFVIAAAVVCVPFGLVGWFCAWAALYTELDSGSDASQCGE